MIKKLKLTFCANYDILDHNLDFLTNNNDLAYHNFDFFLLFMIY